VLRAVIDTNVWVSALLNQRGAPAQLRAALTAGRFTLVISDPLLDELADVLARPRIARRYGVTAADIAELLLLLRRIGQGVPVVGDLQVCRDPDDDIVIETAIRGRADVLVTGDDDLKAAPEVASVLAAAGVEILTARQFLLRLQESAAAGMEDAPRS
jgi:uncharacterized protein